MREAGLFLELRRGVSENEALGWEKCEAMASGAGAASGAKSDGRPERPSGRGRMAVKPVVGKGSGTGEGRDDRFG